MSDHEKYYRKEWMTDDQWECAKLYADLVFGFHHVVGKFKEWGYGIEINVTQGRLSTFDFDGLTRLVLMAHERCIRAEVMGSGPGMVKIVLHKRKGREGNFAERHPSLEDLAASIQEHLEQK